MVRRNTFTLGKGEIGILCVFSEIKIITKNEIRNLLSSSYAELFSGNRTFDTSISSLEDKQLIKKERNGYKLTEYGKCQKKVLIVNMKCMQYKKSKSG